MSQIIPSYDGLYGKINQITNKSRITLVVVDIVQDPVLFPFLALLIEAHPFLATADAGSWTDSNAWLCFSSLETNEANIIIEKIDKNSQTGSCHPSYIPKCRMDQKERQIKHDSIHPVLCFKTSFPPAFCLAERHGSSPGRRWSLRFLMPKLYAFNQYIPLKMCKFDLYSLKIHHN